MIETAESPPPSRRPGPIARASSGSALVFALTLSSLLFLLATSLAILSRYSTVVENAHSDTTWAFYAAEAGINRGFAEFKNIFQGFNVPQGSDFNPRTMTVGGTAVRYQLSLVDGPDFVRIPAGKRYAGLNSIDYVFTNVASALAPDGSIKNRLGAQSLLHNIPLFQFIAFYTNDLEIQPLPDMTLHGRVHTNDDLYLNSSGNTLTIEDEPLTKNPRRITTVEVTAVQSIYRKRKDSGACAGTVTIDTLRTDPVTGDLAPRTLPCNGGAALTAADVAPWLGSLEFGVPILNPPPASASTRGANGPLDYWPKADVRIVMDIGRTMPLGQPFGIVPAGPNPLPRLYVIEVQNLDGSRNVAATNLLWQFMLANPGKIFYTDVPNVSCAGSYPTCVAAAANYNPPFRDYTKGTAPNPGGTAAQNNAMVYRQANDAALSANWTARNAVGDNRIDYRRGAFFNNREKRGGQGTFMVLLNLDLQALMQWNLNQAAGARLFDPADRTEGGIVVFASVMNSALNGGVPPRPTNWGVRVFDSPVLPFPAGMTNSADPTGLTVVSDQAIYVEGNYNCNDVNRCNGNPVQPTWNPSAFIGDTINVLSENWENGGNDSKSVLPLANRPASDTEVNAAFIGGQDITTPTEGSGGLENYPRFHETWSGDALNYLGSFVSLGVPSYSNGPWCANGQSCNVNTGACTGRNNCNIYDPPVRNWDYDGRFEDAANLPPLNPQVVYSEQQLFDEQFN